MFCGFQMTKSSENSEQSEESKTRSLKINDFQIYSLYINVIHQCIFCC